MTREEYKTGMFHVSSLPKVDTSSKPQPTTISGNSNTATPSSRLTSEKPLNSVSQTWKLPALKSSPETSGPTQPAPLLAKPAVKPGVAVTTQATKVKPNNKVIHIKNEKLNPLSKTLSRLGEKINEAHAEGDLKEGSFALDNDIHNLLKTIGKLKSQVDNLRNDQANLGKDGDDMPSSSQSGTSSKLPSQSHETRASNSQSQSNVASTSQSTHSSEYTASLSVNETSHPNEKLSNNTLLKSGNIPLKLRIVGQAPKQRQKNVTILNLKLSEKMKQVRNKPLGTPSALKPVTGNTAGPATSAPNDKTLPQSITSAQTQTVPMTAPPKPPSIEPQSTSSAPTGQTAFLTVPPKPPIVDIPLDSNETSQNKNLASLETTKADPKPPQQTNPPQTTNDVQSNTQQTEPGGNVIHGAGTATEPIRKPATNMAEVSQPSISPSTTSSLNQENKVTAQKPLPSQPTSEISPISHNGTITQQSNTLQSPSPPITSGNTVTQKPKITTQDFVHEISTIPNVKQRNAPAQLANTRPNVPLKTNFVKAPVSHKDFAAIENNLAQSVGKERPAVKSSVPG